MVARCGENVEIVIVPEMEKEIVVEHGGSAWMALYAPSASLPSVAAAAVSVAVGSCALSLSAFLFTVLKQRVGCL